MKQIGSHHTLGYMSPPEAGNMEHAKVEDCVIPSLCYMWNFLLQIN